MHTKLSALLAVCVVAGFGLTQAQAETKTFSAAKLDKTTGKTQFRSTCGGYSYSSPYCSPCSYCNYSPCCSYDYSYCSPCSSYSYCSARGLHNKHAFKTCHARLFPRAVKHH